MENLLALLDKIQHLSPLSFFETETIVVQNAGMQHWLNMSLAQSRSISMNIGYALPAQFLWKLIRAMASEDKVPEQSPFSREVLTWRIYGLLAQDEVLNDQDFEPVTSYWQGKSGAKETEKQAQLKRYQLAHQVADLFEQYLIFRPDWIDAWSAEQSENCQPINFATAGNNSLKTELENNADLTDEFSGENPLENNSNNTAEKMANWQGKLWQLLTKEQSYNPVTLVESAIENLADKKHLLPKRLSFFGLNAMAPMWLSFINKLSEHTQVHFFHLNPCFDYWGDIQSQKTAMSNIKQWVEGFDDEKHHVGNPLLANLGQQGREFLAMLQDYSTVDIDAFESNTITNNEHQQEQDAAKSLTLLERVQQDILTLSDASQQSLTTSQHGKTAVSAPDDSITITSCHSALREVQGLHDWLLHQFNNDKSLTPKDVIVMCPQIENYAPYIDAVFVRGWQDLDDNIPPLPCSIADRVSKDAEPIVAAFLEILSLPDSRFQVSQLLSFLRLPAMQRKFGLSTEEIEKISLWLNQASVHWGLDAEHKQQVLSQHEVKESEVTAAASEKVVSKSTFTWQEGLSRLLRGFAYGDNETIFQDQLLLSTVEGNDAELLGKLMWVIERLQSYAQQLAKPRTAVQWKAFLFELIDQLFDIEGEYCFNDLSKSIEALAENCEHAQYQQQMPLVIVSDFLHSFLGQPEPGRQFMIGQVTFCSMVPMRSIPFKVVAILGLNDGEFPRQRQPQGFDLLALTQPRLGDRSRRGDDRYLFLEAIISARQSLYLSYQGNNIKTNSEKQPSIVVKEFIEYLTLGYQWGKDATKNSNQISGIKLLPMQAFSEQNYQGRFASFDDKWLTLTQGTTPDNGQATPESERVNDDRFNAETFSAESFQILPADNGEEASDKDTLELSLSALIKFFQHPSRYFAEQQFNLRLGYDEQLNEDVEPFEINALESYLLREKMLAEMLDNGEQHNALSDDIAKEALANIQLSAQLSGKFPDLPTTQKTFEQWQKDSEQLSDLILSNNAATPTPCHVSYEIDANELFSQTSSPNSAHIKKVILKAELPVKGDKLVLYRSSSAKAKDKLSLYLNQLLLQVCQIEQAELSQVSQTCGYYFDTKSQKTSELEVSNLPEASGQLKRLVASFLQGQQQPLLLNAELAFKRLAAKQFDQNTLAHFWHDPNSFAPFGADPYIQYFWPNCPSIEQLPTELEQIYLPMHQVFSAKKSSANKGKK